MSVKRALTVEQYNKVMQEISKNHRFYHGGKNIKYITPHWDARDMMCYSIIFRVIAQREPITFNEREGHMFEDIMKWLDGE